MSSTESIWERLMKIDRRILYWTLIAIIIIPLVRPLGLPIPISSNTVSLYDTIEDLPAGSIVMFGVDHTVARIPELMPGVVAMFKHTLKKNLRVIVYTMQPDGDGPIETMLEYSESLLANKEYGVDYAVFGYIPGLETAIASLASDPKGTLAEDKQGTPTGQLEIFEEITDANDVDLVISSTGGGLAIHYINHWNLVYGTKICMNGISFNFPGLVVNYQAGLLSGVLNGQRGGAEYEVLIKEPAIGARLLDAQSLGHLVLIGYIILGNIGFAIISLGKGGKKYG